MLKSAQTEKQAFCSHTVHRNTTIYPIYQVIDSATLLDNHIDKSTQQPSFNSKYTHDIQMTKKIQHVKLYPLYY